MGSALQAAPCCKTGHPNHDGRSSALAPPCISRTCFSIRVGTPGQGSTSHWAGSICVPGSVKFLSVLKQLTINISVSAREELGTWRNRQRGRPSQTSLNFQGTATQNVMGQGGLFVTAFSRVMNSFPSPSTIATNLHFHFLYSYNFSNYMFAYCL